MRALLACLLAAVLGAAQAQERNLAVAVAEQRIALVIGNSAYKVGPLRNPVNDARAMSAALRKAGFEVMHRENLAHRQLFEATRDFGERLKPGAVALFYYAGHGMQVRDRNYLIPVEADLKHEEEVPYTSIDASFALDVMHRARTRVNIVILDACRNNPFARSFRSGSSGLAQMEAPSGTLIAYATAPGRVASDGTGDHGLYTQHLLRHLDTPNLPVEILFKRVREGVERETRSQQIPWESSSLKGDFTFVAAAAAPAAPLVQAGPAPDSAFELAFWDSIKSSKQVADYQAYLAQYPNGRFAVLAKARISSLAPSTGAPPAPPAAPVASLAPTPVASGRLPVRGERWVYRYTDLWKPGDPTEITHAVAEVREGTVRETISAELEGRRVEHHALWPASAGIREWKLERLSLREFSPFALALELLKRDQAPAEVDVRLQDNWSRPWAVTARVSGEEEVSVPAGRFRAIKLLVRGQREVTGSTVGRFDMTVWFAPEVKRYVKMTYTSYVAARGLGNPNDPWQRDLYELVSAPR